MLTFRPIPELFRYFFFLKPLKRGVGECQH